MQRTWAERWNGEQRSEGGGCVSVPERTGRRGAARGWNLPASKVAEGRAPSPAAMGRGIQAAGVREERRCVSWRFCREEAKRRGRDKRAHARPVLHPTSTTLQGSGSFLQSQSTPLGAVRLMGLMGWSKSSVHVSLLPLLL